MDRAVQMVLAGTHNARDAAEHVGLLAKCAQNIRKRVRLTLQQARSTNARAYIKWTSEHKAQGAAAVRASDGAVDRGLDRLQELPEADADDYGGCERAKDEEETEDEEEEKKLNLIRPPVGVFDELKRGTLDSRWRGATSGMLDGAGDRGGRGSGNSEKEQQQNAAAALATAITNRTARSGAGTAPSTHACSGDGGAVTIAESEADAIVEGHDDAPRKKQRMLTSAGDDRAANAAALLRNCRRRADTAIAASCGDRGEGALTAAGSAFGPAWCQSGSEGHWRRRAVEQLDAETGDVLNCWPSQRAAAAGLGIPQGNICHGERSAVCLRPHTQAC